MPKNYPKVIEHTCSQISSLEFRNFDAEVNSKLLEKLRLAERMAGERSTRISKLITEAIYVRQQISRTNKQYNRFGAQPEILAERKALIGELTKIEKQLETENASLDSTEPQFKFASIDLISKKKFLYYNDERILINEIVGRTEQVLRKMANHRLTRGNFNTTVGRKSREALKRPARENGLANSGVSIDPKAFREFAKSGKLVLPPSKDSFAISTSIQKLNPVQLKTRLNEQVPSLDLFKTANQAKSTENFVAKGAEAQKEDLLKLRNRLTRVA